MFAMKQIEDGTGIRLQLSPSGPADQKQTMAEQSSAHMHLSAQLTAAQTQLSILQGEIERATMSVSAMKAELELGRQRARDAEDRAQKRVAEMEEERDATVASVQAELREAESIRRKLHNQVQELKGNIRVFARVRPALREFDFCVGGVVCTLELGLGSRNAEGGPWTVQLDSTQTCNAPTCESAWLTGSARKCRNRRHRRHFIWRRTPRGRDGPERNCHHVQVGVGHGERTGTSERVLI